KLRENTLYHRGDKTIDASKSMLIKMAGLVDVKQVESGFGLHLSQPGIDAWLDVEHGAIKNYLQSLQGKHTQLVAQQESLAARLSNKNYVAKAPKNLVKETKDQLADIESAIDKVVQQI